eukprot:285940-Pleurochrysis_carterae.AAC.4
MSARTINPDDALCENRTLDPDDALREYRTLDPDDLLVLPHTASWRPWLPSDWGRPHPMQAAGERPRAAAALCGNSCSRALSRTPERMPCTQE